MDMHPWPELEQYSAGLFLQGMGLKLFYFDTGPSEKPPCLLIHGLADEADTWRHIIGPLSRRFRVIAPDLPGFGRSGKPKIRYSIPSLSGCLLELMDSLSLDRVLLIGSSLGGMLAQYMALGHPDRVRGVVTADGLLLYTPPRLTLSRILFLTPGAGEFLYSGLSRRPGDAYDSLRGYYAGLDGMPLQDREFLAARVNRRVRDKGQRYAFFFLLRRMGLWLRFRQKAFRTALKACSVPTLILWGEEDRILPRAGGELLERIQDSAEFVVIPHAGHLPHQESPLLFLEALDRWLEDPDHTIAKP